MTYKIPFKLFLLFNIIIVLFTSCGKYQNVNMYQKNDLINNDEKNLLQNSIKLSKSIDEHDNTLTESKYIDYPNEILKKLLSDDNIHFSQNINFNIKIIKNPALNAFALPNGTIYIHSGLISKLDNEAQLALLIAHEMTHVIYKHSLKQKENLKTGATVASIFGVLSSPFDAGILSMLLFNSSISGYSQNHENEADRIGYEQIVKAGYNPKEASKLFDIMLHDIQLNEIEQPYFFSTHPRVEERIKNSKTIIESNYKENNGNINKEQFHEYIKPLIIENIEQDLKLRRFKSADFSIKKLNSREENSSNTNYLKAELIRLKKGKNSFNNALEYYKKALDIDNTNAKAFRGMGYLYFQNNNKNEALLAFNNYLSLNENAKDKAYIEYYIKQCDKKEKDD